MQNSPDIPPPPRLSVDDFVMLISFRFKKFIIFICSYQKLNILHDRQILLNFILK